MCVTEEDVELWNKVSSISGLDTSALENISALYTSASAWNSTYETVSSNSANWLTEADISAIDVEKLDSVYETVNTNSADWKIYFSNTISGEGTITNPYGVNRYLEYIKLTNQISGAVAKLYKQQSPTSSPFGTQNWISLDAQDDINGINPYIKSLFSAVADKDNDQDKSLVKHGELIEWLIKNNGVSANNWIAKYGVKWKRVPQPTKSADIAKYTDKNTVYFSCD